MNPERIQTTLRFVGDWPWWASLALALVLGAAAWIFYVRETINGRLLRWLLPTLRAGSVIMLVLMLCGPVLHHRKVIGRLSKLSLFVDGSRSMGLADPSMDPVRRKLILQRLGLLQGDLEKMDQKNPAIQDALAKFDTLTRTERLQTELLGGGKDSLLSRLAARHDVRLLELDGSGAAKIWQPTAKDSAAPLTLPVPAGETTDLAGGPKGIEGGKEKEDRAAIVLFSDGQHNDGESPLEAAKLLAGRGIPVFTVSYGSLARPADLAVMRVDGPASAFFKDNIRGTITLKDDMPAGLPFAVTVHDGAKVLWQKQLVTDGSNLRKVPFDIPIADDVKERLANKNSGLETASIPLELKVSVSDLKGDGQPENNEGSLRVRAVTQRRKLLLLDGRPRWETRFLRNLFERDEQWEVSTVIAGTTAGESGFARGIKPGEFPNDAALLQTYDLIVFGDIPRAIFKGDELEWIREFVANRGGALVFIDGARQCLPTYADTPIAPLFPVAWKGPGAREDIGKLSLTSRSATMAPFVMAGDKAQNSETWGHLNPPHWIADVTVLPGAETLVEADVASKKVPVVVCRTFGAGRVFYHAIDDSWRWRFEVADEYHVKYWNQVANWIAEPPFAVRDKLVSLDTDGITYRPGESASLRVRLRDGEGRPVTNATVDAILSREGVKVATIRLAPDDNAGGLFRGKTAALTPGDYEVSVQSAAIAERDARVRASFKVAPQETGELIQLVLDEELLRRMSSLSGGEYLREENIDKLFDLLAPMSQGRVIESDTVLWQSYWWFVPLILLLTTEWILRKRAGLL